MIKKEYIELLGILGVIGSLVFVGLQLSFDRDVAIGGQYQARSEMRIQVPLSQLENSEYISTTAKRWEANRPSWWDDDVEAYFSQSGEPMSAFVQDMLSHTAFGIIMDNNAFQYSQGLMNEDNWSAFRSMLRNFIEQDPFRRAFITTRNGMPNLSIVVNQLVLEIEAGE